MMLFIVNALPSQQQKQCMLNSSSCAQRYQRRIFGSSLKSSWISNKCIDMNLILTSFNENYFQHSFFPRLINEAHLTSLLVSMKENAFYVYYLYICNHSIFMIFNCPNSFCNQDDRHTDKAIWNYIYMYRFKTY